MKRFVITLVCIVIICSIHAQNIVDSLPSSTVIKPFYLEVGYNYNSVISFPGTIRKAYWGYKDIIAMEVPKVENVLLVKAAKRNFSPTNLHVFTMDGKLYAFNVTYNDNPVSTTFDLRRLAGYNNESVGTDIHFSDQVVNEAQLKQLMDFVRTAKPFLIKSKNKFDLKVQLTGIYFSNNILFFSFIVSNFSNLDYTFDFNRFYLRDHHTTKLSSFQQREITPVKKDTLTSLAGHSTKDFVIAVPQFTIPDQKEFLFEMYERNGGRNISLRIKNRHLLKAKPL